MTRSLAAFLAGLAVLCACSGCTRHEAILDPRGMALTTREGVRSVGHLRTTTRGLSLFGVWSIAPSSQAATLQFVYDRMAEEAAVHGASSLLDLRSDRCCFPILPPLLFYYSITMTANMAE